MAYIKRLKDIDKIPFISQTGTSVVGGFLLSTSYSLENTTNFMGSHLMYL